MTFAGIILSGGNPYIKIRIVLYLQDKLDSLECHCSQIMYEWCHNFTIYDFVYGKKNYPSRIREVKERNNEGTKRAVGLKLV